MLEAFYVIVRVVAPSRTTSAYLRGVVDLKRRLARCVKVSAASQRVVLAYNCLGGVRWFFMLVIISPGLTDSMLPGNLTVVYCSSL